MTKHPEMATAGEFDFRGYFIGTKPSDAIVSMLCVIRLAFNHR